MSWERCPSNQWIDRPRLASPRSQADSSSLYQPASPRAHVLAPPKPASKASAPSLSTSPSCAPGLAELDFHTAAAHGEFSGKIRLLPASPLRYSCPPDGQPQCLLLPHHQHTPTAQKILRMLQRPTLENEVQLPVTDDMTLYHARSHDCLIAPSQSPLGKSHGARSLMNRLFRKNSTPPQWSEGSATPVDPKGPRRTESTQQSDVWPCAQVYSPTGSDFSRGCFARYKHLVLWSSLVFLLFLALAIVLTLEVIVPNHIEKVLYQAHMVPEIMLISDVTSDSFRLKLEGTIHKDSSAAVIVQMPRELDVHILKLDLIGDALYKDFEREQKHRPLADADWWDPRELSALATDKIYLGALALEPIRSHGNTDVMKVDGEFHVENEAGFDEFMQGMLRGRHTPWLITGEVQVKILGISFDHIPFERILMLEGTRLLPDETLSAESNEGEGLLAGQVESGAELIKLESIEFTDDDSVPAITFKANVNIMNNSPLSIENLGKMEFDLLYAKAPVARLVGEVMPYKRGLNAANLTGYFRPGVPQVTELLTSFLQHQPAKLVIAARQPSSSWQQQEVTIFTTALQDLRLETSIPIDDLDHSFILKLRVLSVEVEGQDAERALLLSPAELQAAWSRVGYDMAPIPAFPKNVIRRRSSPQDRAERVEARSMTRERKLEQRDFRRSVRQERRRRRARRRLSAETGDSETPAHQAAPSATEMLAHFSHLLDGLVDVSQKVWRTGAPLALAALEVIHPKISSEAAEAARGDVAAVQRQTSKKGRVEVPSDLSLELRDMSGDVDLHTSRTAEDAETESMRRAEAADMFSGLQDIVSVLEGSGLGGGANRLIAEIAEVAIDTFGRGGEAEPDEAVIAAAKERIPALINRLVNPWDTTFDHPVAPIDVAALAVRRDLMEAPQRPGVRWKSDIEGMYEKMREILFKRLVLNGQMLAGVWHPFPDVELPRINAQGIISARRTGSADWLSLGNISTSLVQDVIAHGQDEQKCSRMLNLPKEEIRKGVLIGHADMKRFDYTATVDVTPSVGMMDLLEEVVSGPGIDVAIKNGSLSGTIVVNGQTSLLLQDPNISQGMRIPGLAGLTGLTLNSVMLGNTNEITLRLNVTMKNDAPILLDIGPVFLDWMYQGRRMGPVTIVNLQLHPGPNDVIAYAGIYPSVGNMVVAMQLFGVIMESRPLLLCMSGRESISEEEEMTLLNAPFPWTKAIYEGSQFLEDACAMIPPLTSLQGPMQSQVQPVVFKLLKAIGGAAKSARGFFRPWRSGGATQEQAGSGATNIVEPVAREEESIKGNDEPLR